MEQSNSNTENNLASNDNNADTNNAQGGFDFEDNMNNRTNVTARDHLFHAMFSRMALTYDRTFPPVARRILEFFLLITALLALFILIYIHVAFVKSPITCLDHVKLEDFTGNENTGKSDNKNCVIRVEILTNPPKNYSLMDSYDKEYDYMIPKEIHTIKSESIKLHLPISKFTFYDIVRRKCSSNFFYYYAKPVTSDPIKNGAAILNSEEYSNSKDDYNLNDINADLKNEFKEESINKKSSKSSSTSSTSENWFFNLFNFPINPILEQAEYWREKLSVKAMAPFRQTFNELELFAKSVFTEEKYIMEYSIEYGLLRLSPAVRERLNIPVHFIILDANKDKCFGGPLSRFLLQEFVGYDQIIIGSLKKLAEKQNGKGFVRNVVSGEHYRFVNSWMSRTSYLAAGFIMIIFTLSVSMLLRYSHHQIFVFIVDLLRMLENNLQLSFPAAPLLTVVLALVGMEAIMSEFFNDTSTAFYTIVIIWLADQYEAVCCRTYISKYHWPKYFYLYHFAFYAYHYRFNGQFSGLALLCSWLFIQHSMCFFFHHYELPRLLQGLAVRNVVDSVLVATATTATSIGAGNVINNSLITSSPSTSSTSRNVGLSSVDDGDVDFNLNQESSIIDIREATTNNSDLMSLVMNDEDDERSETFTDSEGVQYKVILAHCNAETENIYIDNNLNNSHNVTLEEDPRSQRSNFDQNGSTYSYNCKIKEDNNELNHKSKSSCRPNDKSNRNNDGDNDDDDDKGGGDDDFQHHNNKDNCAFSCHNNRESEINATETSKSSTKQFNTNNYYQSYHSSVLFTRKFPFHSNITPQKPIKKRYLIKKVTSSQLISSSISSEDNKKLMNIQNNHENDVIDSMVITPIQYNKTSTNSILNATRKSLYTKPRYNQLTSTVPFIFEYRAELLELNTSFAITDYTIIILCGIKTDELIFPNLYDKIIDYIPNVQLDKIIDELMNIYNKIQQSEINRYKLKEDILKNYEIMLAKKSLTLMKEIEKNKMIYHKKPLTIPYEHFHVKRNLMLPRRKQSHIKKTETKKLSSKLQQPNQMITKSKQNHTKQQTLKLYDHVSLKSDDIEEEQVQLKDHKYIDDPTITSSISSKIKPNKIDNKKRKKFHYLKEMKKINIQKTSISSTSSINTEQLHKRQITYNGHIMKVNPKQENIFVEKAVSSIHDWLLTKNLHKYRSVTVYHNLLNIIINELYDNIFDLYFKLKHNIFIKSLLKKSISSQVATYDNDGDNIKTNDKLINILKPIIQQTKACLYYLVNLDQSYINPLNISIILPSIILQCSFRYEPSKMRAKIQNPILNQQPILKYQALLFNKNLNKQNSLIKNLNNQINIKKTSKIDLINWYSGGYNDYHYYYNTTMSNNDLNWDDDSLLHSDIKYYVKVTPEEPLTTKGYINTLTITGIDSINSKSSSSSTSSDTTKKSSSSSTKYYNKRKNELSNDLYQFLQNLSDEFLITDKSKNEQKNKLRRNHNSYVSALFPRENKQIY